MAPRWSLSSARIDTSSGGSPPHLPRRCWCAKVLVRIQGVCTRASTCRDGTEQQRRRRGEEEETGGEGERRARRREGEGEAACVCVYVQSGAECACAAANGRGRRECWRAATRRLRRCRGSSSLPLRPFGRGAVVGETCLDNLAGDRGAPPRRTRTRLAERPGEGRGGVVLSTPTPHHSGQRAIMSARSSDWRSGANPSGVALDAFSDVLLLSLSFYHSLSFAYSLFLSLGRILCLCPRYPLLDDESSARLSGCSSLVPRLTRSFSLSPSAVCPLSPPQREFKGVNREYAH